MGVLLLLESLPAFPILQRLEQFLGRHTLVQISAICNDFLCSMGGHDDDAMLDQRQESLMSMLTPFFGDRK
jgi:hypothetical protein